MSDADRSYPMTFALPEARARDGRPAFTVGATDVTVGPLQDGRIWSLTRDAGMPHDGSWPEALLVRIAVRRFRGWLATEHPDWTVDLDAGDVLAARGVLPGGVGTPEPAVALAIAAGAGG